MNAVVWETNLPGIQFLNRGKVRDLYEVGDHLLIVATDRLSAFDVVLPTPIPDKGRVLTQLSLFWFDLLRDVIPNHIVTATDFPPELAPYRAQLEGRSMLCQANKSAADRVRRARIPVRLGMERLSRHRKNLRHRAAGGPARIRAAAGSHFHSFDQGHRGPRRKHFVRRARSRSSARSSPNAFAPSAWKFTAAPPHMPNRAESFWRTQNLNLASSEIELIWIDEALTPDSSRFWPAEGYQPGRAQPSFDKQYVRDYLERIGWNKQPPGPELPPDVVAATREKYREAYRQLTGHELS